MVQWYLYIRIHYGLLTEEENTYWHSAICTISQYQEEQRQMLWTWKPRDRISCTRMWSWACLLRGSELTWRGETGHCPPAYLTGQRSQALRGQMVFVSLRATQLRVNLRERRPVSVESACLTSLSLRLKDRGQSEWPSGERQSRNLQLTYRLSWVNLFFPCVKPWLTNITD